MTEINTIFRSHCELNDCWGMANGTTTRQCGIELSHVSEWTGPAGRNVEEVRAVSRRACVRISYPQQWSIGRKSKRKQTHCNGCSVTDRRWGEPTHLMIPRWLERKRRFYFRSGHGMTFHCRMIGLRVNTSYNLKSPPPHSLNRCVAVINEIVKLFLFTCMDDDSRVQARGWLCGAIRVMMITIQLYF